MKQRPILFNGAMVRAILNDTKTQTRRTIELPEGFDWLNLDTGTMPDGNGNVKHISELECKYGQVGDQLWVRETWRTDDSLNDKAPSTFSSWPVQYEADGKKLSHGAFHGNTNGKTRVSIHMPRWASRITLEITSIRAERLQSITLGDICKEGLGKSIYDFAPATQAFRAFQTLWESTGGDWKANPWVWVIEFKKVNP